jgi:hypothetical protein
MIRITTPMAVLNIRRRSFWALLRAGLVKERATTIALTASCAQRTPMMGQ